MTFTPISLHSETRIVILIPIAWRSPWTNMMEAQQETWGSMANSSVRVVYFWASKRDNCFWQAYGSIRERMRFGRASRIQLLLDARLNSSSRDCLPRAKTLLTGIQVDVAEGLASLGLSSLAAMALTMEWLNPDYIFRANASAYVHPTRLLHLVNSADLGLDYAGFIEQGRSFWGWDFVNGAGMLMSRQSVIDLVNHHRELDCRYMDDVAIGKLMKELGYRPIGFDRPLIRSAPDIQGLDRAQIESAFFRLRNLDTPRCDPELLRLLHARILQESP